MPKKYLPALDGLRSITAIIVVIYHWVHFHYGLQGQKPSDINLLPLPSLLWPIYLFGGWATILFFSLSGFIFYWLYADRVADRTISFGEFFWLRFTRLYPLHFVTLMAVAIGQYAWFVRTGTHFMFTQNDTRHFVLHLALASNATGLSEWSFNAPVWSVSIEVVLYAIFFVLLFFRFRSWIGAALLCLAAIVVPEHRGLLADGLAAFFAGGLAYRIYAATMPGRSLGAITMAVVVLWLILPWFLTIDGLVTWYGGLPNRFVAGDHDVGLWFVTKVSRFAPHLLLFPATVLVVAWWDTGLSGERRWLSRLGEISYSSYMLHFPLQLAFAATTDAAGISRDFYRTPLSMLAFFAILIPLSFACYHCFERPIQNRLRSMMKLRWSKRSGDRIEQRNEIVLNRTMSPMDSRLRVETASSKSTESCLAK